MTEKLGIIAGAGNLPFEVLKEAKGAGLEVHVCGVKNEASPEIDREAHSHEWVNVGQLGKLIKYFQSKEVSQIIFSGKIHKFNLLKGEVIPDLELVKIFANVKDRKDDTLLGTIANHLTSVGLKVLDSTTYLKQSMPSAGLLTKKPLTADEMKTAKFGFEMARQIAGLDIGQTVVVKDVSVVAVESVEGTDACIRRGGELAGGKVIVVKVAKPNQDMRFDVPAIGLGTLESLEAAKASVLAVEADKTIVVELDKFLIEAEKKKIKVIAV